MLINPKGSPFTFFGTMLHFQKKNQKLQPAKFQRLVLPPKTLMNLSSSLMKVEYNWEILAHERFREKFRKS